MNRNKRIVLQLGMPYGTAVHRLRKNILFNFAQRLKEDVCFKCDKKIEFVEELSIEHKQPWENKNSDLFWNLNNIAFSHLKCNRNHSYGSGPVARIAPEGLSWCSGHQKFLPIEKFHENEHRINGYNNYCKSCYSTNRKEYKGR